MKKFILLTAFFLSGCIQPAALPGKPQASGFFGGPQAADAQPTSRCKALVSKSTDCGLREFKEIRKRELCDEQALRAVGLEIDEWCNKKVGLKEFLEDASPSEKRKCRKEIAKAGAKLVPAMLDDLIDICDDYL